MANIIISPSKYVQGKGELANIAQYATKLGKKPFILISEGGKKRVGGIIEDSFKDTGCELVFEAFHGECSKNEINRLVAIVKEKGCDLVIGVGGGKIFDTAKAVAYYVESPVIVCPTIAATDAPCSALTVVYTDDGVFEEYLWLPANPNLVLVDTDIIAKAPARLLVSGMGDALATYFEAKACQASNATSCAGGHITIAAITLAKVCYQTLIEEGVKAKLAVEAGVCTTAVEKVITFCMDVGLPTTFADLGIEHPDKDALMEAATLAASPDDTLGNEPLEVTPDKVYAAMVGADALGRYYKGL